MKRLKTIFGWIIILSGLCGQKATAQSTIFNIPSTDTLPTREIYAEFGFGMQLPAASGTRTYDSIPRIVVGIPGNIEAGANVWASQAPGSTEFYVQPNVKWKFASSDTKGLAASAGTLLYIPMNYRSSLDTYGIAYGNFSKQVKSGSYGPRFTAGPYIVYSGSSWEGPKSGVMAGIEQPLHPRISIIADWVSGNNDLGYFTPGVAITLPHGGSAGAGYSIGNDSYNGNNNRQIFLYYGITF